MNKIFIILLPIAVIVLVAFLVLNYPSDLNASDTDVVKNITFNNSGLSFEYPETFKEVEHGEAIINGSSDWVYILNIYDNSTKITIAVQKNDKGPSPSLLKTYKKSSLNSTSGEVLNDTSQTVNGIIIEKMIFKLKDPDTGNEIRYIQYYLKPNETTYSITFIGTSDNFEDMSKLANNVINSVRAT